MFVGPNILYVSVHEFSRYAQCTHHVIKELEALKWAKHANSLLWRMTAGMGFKFRSAISQGLDSLHLTTPPLSMLNQRTAENKKSRFWKNIATQVKMSPIRRRQEKCWPVHDIQVQGTFHCSWGQCFDYPKYEFGKLSGHQRFRWVCCGPTQVVCLSEPKIEASHLGSEDDPAML